MSAPEIDNDALLQALWELDLVKAVGILGLDDDPGTTLHVMSGITAGLLNVSAQPPEGYHWSPKAIVGEPPAWFRMVAADANNDDDTVIALVAVILEAGPREAAVAVARLFSMASDILHDLANKGTNQ